MNSIFSKGFLLILLSAVSFSFMAMLIRYVSHIDAYKTALFRFVIGLGILGTAAIFGKIRLDFINGRLLFSRGLLGGFAVFAFFLSIVKLGIGKGTMISYMYPVFARIASSILLREKMNIKSIGSVILATAGIGLLFINKSGNAGWIGIYEMIALLGSICAGLAVVSVKKLHETDTTYSIFFAQCAIGLWIVVIPANLVPCSVGYSGGVILLAIGIAAACGQLLMTEGFKTVSVTSGSLLGLLTPVLNLFIGFLFFKEPVSVWMMIGSVLILVSCATVAFEKQHT